MLNGLQKGAASVTNQACVSGPALTRGMSLRSRHFLAKVGTELPAFVSKCQIRRLNPCLRAKRTHHNKALDG